MSLVRNTIFTLISVLIVNFSIPSNSLAASCNLPKSTAQIVMVERNINSLEKLITGPERESTISGLRSKIAALKSRGGGFAAIAAPIETDCRALFKLFAKVKAAKKRRDATLKKLRLERKAGGAKIDRARAVLKKAVAQHDPTGCGDGSTLSPERYKVCKPLNDEINRNFIWPFNARLKKFKKRDKELLNQIKATNAAFAKIEKSARSRWQSVQDRAKKHKSSYASWGNDLRVVWGETNIKLSTAYKAQKTRRAAGTTNKARGGELGKLSGPLKSGNSNNSPGSKKHPSGFTAKEGGAMGQAKAARSTSEAGVRAGSDSSAASKAGRVFDRGDIKYSGGKPSKGVVDARGVTARTVPAHVRQNPRWQSLDNKEKTYRVEQAKAQKQIAAIKKKLQSGSGNKGQLQVDLVRARESNDKIQSKINVVKVEKESFSLSLEDKPAPKPGAKNTKGKN
jgi:hypothetical protein